MKKLLASLVVMLLLVSCCLISAFPTSASDINYDDFWISEDGIIVEYLGAGGDVVVPSVDADGNPITGIDSRAFAMNSDITSVVICEGIETFGTEAFEECTNLMEVSLPYSLKEVGYSAFRSTGITQIVIPAQLKVVPPDFISHECLDVVISEGVEEVDTGALKGKFAKLVFPQSVYKIGSYVYGGLYTSVKTCEIYIINPDCEVDVVGKHAMVGARDEVNNITVDDGMGPLVYRHPMATGEVKVYAEKDSTVEDYFNEYMKDKDVNCRFIGKDAEFFESYQQDIEEKGIYKPTQNVMDSTPGNNEPDDDEPGDDEPDTSEPDDNEPGDNEPDTSEPDDEDPDTSKPSGNSSQSGNKKPNSNNNNNNNNNNTANQNNSGSNSGLLIIVLAVAGGFILLIIIVVVVLVIVMGNKKKKKNKKKAAKAEEVVAEEVVEAPVEEITEESGEEE